MSLRSRRTPLALVAAAAIAVSTLATTYGTTGSFASAPRSVASTTSHSRSHSMVNVYFILNWLPNVEFAGLWVAQQKGWWRQAGINMGFRPWSPSVFPETQVPERGGNTFGFQSAAAIAIARSQNVPITAVYTDTQKSVFALTVMKNGPIHKLTDLRGRAVGYQSHELYVPATMLAFAGLKPSQWKPVPVGFDPVVLTAGRVSAYLSFITNEPIALSMKGVATRNFLASDFGFHSYDDVMFTSNSLIRSNPALVRKVTGIVARGYQWAHTHPVATARLTVANYFRSQQGYSAAQNLEQQTREIETFRSFSIHNGRFDGLMNTSTWRDLINTLFRYHEIKSKPNAVTIYTNRFNPYR